MQRKIFSHFFFPPPMVLSFTVFLEIRCLLQGKCPGHFIVQYLIKRDASFYFGADSGFLSVDCDNGVKCCLVFDQIPQLEAGDYPQKILDEGCLSVLTLVFL